MSCPVRAIVSHEALGPDFRGWQMENVTVRSPNAGELLVRLVACGICQTDVAAGSAPTGEHGSFYPRVLGHEGTFPTVNQVLSVVPD
jgi:Zn-dependent alcohol dehydrogenase